MNLEIRNTTDIYLNNKIIYLSKDEILDVRIFDNQKIIVQINSNKNNLFCINQNGKLLWIAESVTPLEYSPYLAFDIRDGYVYASADLPGYGRGVKLDPNTGKILEQEIIR